MKNLIYLLLLIPIISFSQVGVNTTLPNAMLDVQSTSNGVLIPRVQLTSITDNATITNPAGGALITSTLVYNIAPAGVSPNDVVAGFYYWNNNISRWIPIAASSGWELDGNTAITSPAIPATYGTSTIGATENFIGTTDNNDVTIGTNNIERMRIKNTTGNVGIGLATAPAKLSVFRSFASPTIPNTTTNAMVRIGNNNEGLDIGKADGTSNYAAWFQSGYNGSTTDPLSFQPLGGNVGIATTNPSLAKFQVDGMAGNTTALFRGNSTTSQGLSMVSDWPGIYFNSYYNGAIRQMSNSGFPTIINTDQSSGGLIFQTTNVANTTSGGIIASIPVRMTITGAGNVGVGTSNPEQLLSSNLGIKVDQSNSNVGTSANTLSFGSGTGESIGSKRTATGNQFGLDFYTANANRMRIFNPGEVVIGQQNGGNLLPGTLSGVNSSLTVWNPSTASQTSDVPVFVARHSGTSGTTWQMGSIEYYTEGEANIGFTYQICPLNDNTFTNLGSSTSSKYFGYRWNQLFCTVAPNVSSDITLKKDIQNLSYGIHQLRNINPITYKFKVDNAGTDKDVPDSEKRTHIGFSAQELKQIVPEIVSSWGYISNNENGYIKAKTPTLGVVYEEMIPVTVNAIKQLDQQQQEIIKTITISDFGTIESNKDETWVSYNSDFKQKLKGTPVVTITATTPNANYYIKNQNKNGFTIKNNNANESLSFNWMAMGKIDENNMEIKTDYSSEIHQQKLNQISSFENSLPTNKEALTTIKSQSK